MTWCEWCHNISVCQAKYCCFHDHTNRLREYFIPILHPLSSSATSFVNYTPAVLLPPREILLGRPWSVRDQVAGGVAVRRQRKSTFGRCVHTSINQSSKDRFFDIGCTIIVTQYDDRMLTPGSGQVGSRVPAEMGRVVSTGRCPPLSRIADSPRLRATVATSNT